MFKYGGYAGKFLYIDLSTGQIKTELIKEELAEDYIGGNGFGAKLLYDLVPSKADPLGDKNILVFSVGPLQGTIMPASNSRTVVITKSPLTGFFMDSYFGGQFGAEFKYAGYDALIVSGKSDKPVYIWIDDDKVELRDASHLWGLKTIDTQIKIKEELGSSNIATATIGPAGENLSLISCTISGVRAAGRGGTGAVWGSKNLKAIAVRGTKDVRVNNIEAVDKYLKEYTDKIKSNPGTGVKLPTNGTTGGIRVNNTLGLLGTRNWQTEVFENVDNISAEAIKEKVFVKHDACFGCIIGCGMLTKTKSNNDKDVITVGPEYETLWALGSNCGVDDIKSIVMGDRMCDEYGIDTISMGATISFVMECYEKGLLEREYFEGMEDLEPVFGNAAAMLRMIKLTGNNIGVGTKLSKGVKKLAKEIGKESYKYAIHAKGLEIPAHSGRGYPGIAVSYATSNRGGTHQDGRSTAERVGKVDINQIEGKGYYEVDVQRMTTIQDCIICCRMLESVLGMINITENHTELLNTITGMEKTVDDLIEIADRVYALERAFNIREGASRADDTIPYRFMNEPIPEGPAKGKYMSEEVMSKLIDEVYEKRGYDKITGAPTYETLKKLKLDFVADDLY